AAAVPQPSPQIMARPESPRPAAAPRKRGLGKLELAILVFLGFDLLLFAGWKLLFGNADSTDDAEIASAEPGPEPEPQPTPEPQPEPVEPVASPPAPEPEPEPAEPSAPRLSVEEAIAAEFPPEPDTPGPVRPAAKSLTDKVFREHMVAARDGMLRKCLDTKMRRTLKIALKVAPSGQVEYARVVGSQGETALGQCVAKQVYKILFPVTHEGGSHTY